MIQKKQEILKKKKMQEFIEAAPASLRKTTSRNIYVPGQGNEYKYVKTNVDDVDLQLEENLFGENEELADFQAYELMNQQIAEKKANNLAQEITMAQEAALDATMGGVNSSRIQPESNLNMTQMPTSTNVNPRMGSFYEDMAPQERQKRQQELEMQRREEEERRI